MRKFCFIIVLFLFSFRVYGLKFQLPPTATVTTTDTLHIYAMFSGDSIAKSTIYYDINNNGQLDSNDSWIMKFKLIDGGFNDEYEVINGM